MKVVCFGDSNTYGYDPRSFWGNRYSTDARWVDILAKTTGWRVINQGENGRCIPRNTVHFPEDTDLLIIMLGTNDLLLGCTPAEASNKMEHFLSSLALDKEKILLIAPPPMTRGEWVPDQRLIDASVTLGKLYMELSEKLGIRFANSRDWNVELSYDGVHFTEAGNRLFAEKLYKTIRCN